MATTGKSERPRGDSVSLRKEWLDRLSSLVDLVKGWAEELDWSTRQIEKKMTDSRLGQYTAPALIMQKGTTRVLLDPIARFAPGAEGVVDLYLMPAYDDIASLCFIDGQWHLHYMLLGAHTGGTIGEADSTPLSKETFIQVLNTLSEHAT